MKKRDKDALTDAQKRILRHIAEKGPETEYDIHTKHRIASTSTVWKAKKLRKLGYVEIKESQDFPKIPHIEKNYLGLTFKGLHYCLLKRLIEVKDAPNLMGKHRIKLPPLPPSSKRLSHIDTMIRYADVPQVAKEYLGLFPLDFFSGLRNLNFQEHKPEEYSGLVYMAIFGSIAKTFLDPEKHKTVIEETKHMREYFRTVRENMKPLFDQDTPV